LLLIASQHWFNVHFFICPLGSSLEVVELALRHPASSPIVAARAVPSKLCDFADRLSGWIHASHAVVFIAEFVVQTSVTDIFSLPRSLLHGLAILLDVLLLVLDAFGALGVRVGS